LADGDRVVNLKEEKEFIDQYVQLRNRYCDLLVTSPVNVAETREWLRRKDIEIKGIVRDNLLIGVVILFLSRSGEITFFSRFERSGLGSKLLSIIEVAAKERGLQEVWAWVLSDNVIAQRSFLKNGYQEKGNSTKEHRGQIMTGFVFRKTLFQVDRQ
jgi:RimJ/RimL family protein N-acetyltransferase